MAWHLKNYERQCEEQYCRSRATVVLYNPWNSICGYFCRRCGKAEVASRNKAEEHRLSQSKHPQG